jgi:hypothetical protein
MAGIGHVWLDHSALSNNHAQVIGEECLLGNMPLHPSVASQLPSAVVAAPGGAKFPSNLLTAWSPEACHPVRAPPRV